MENVWVVFDLDELVAVAASEARARRAAEEHASAEVDRNYFGPTAEKRFLWDDKYKGYLSIFCPRPHHFTGVVHDWTDTGLWVTSRPLLTDEPEPPFEVHMSTLCVCGQNQQTAAFPGGNVFAAHNDKAGDPCPGLPLPFPPTAQEAGPC